jgi:hypothetical protein
VRRVLVLGALGAATLAAGAAPAGATNECRGLMVCVPVAGPWVVVPAGRSVPRRRVEFQLSCPRRFVVGGLDAELSDRAIDVGFLGRLGSPVNPGITTARAAVFYGTFVGGTARTPSFRPHIGCVPASGGGGRVPTAVVAYPPGQPALRRVRTVRVRAGRTTRATAACAAGERLVAASHALGFYTRTPPTSALVASVRLSRRVRGEAVVVVVRGGDAVRGVRAVVQVQAICSGGA